MGRAAPGGMKATSDRIDETDFFIFMQSSHHALVERGKKLLAAVRADDREQLHALWVRFEVLLFGHLDAEERYIFPAFTRDVPDDAFALMRERVLLRDRILAIGIDVELHQLRVAAFEQFLADLFEHGKREEVVLYRWASTMLERKLARSSRRRIASSDLCARR